MRPASRSRRSPARPQTTGPGSPSPHARREGRSSRIRGTGRPSTRKPPASSKPRSGSGPRWRSALGLPEAGEVAQRVPDPVLEGEAGAARAEAQRPQADVVRVTEQLPDDEASARLQDPRQLAERRILVRDLAQDGDQVGGIVGPVPIRHRRRIGTGRRDVGEALLRGAAHGVVEHLLLEVQDVDLSVWLHPLGHVERVVAGTRAHLEDPLPWHSLEDLPQAGPRDQRMGRLDPEALPVGAGGGVLPPPERRPDHGDRPAEDQVAEPHPVNPMRCSPGAPRRKTTSRRSSATLPSSVSTSVQPSALSSALRRSLTLSSLIRSATTWPPEKPISTRPDAINEHPPVR